MAIASSCDLVMKGLAHSSRNGLLVGQSVAAERLVERGVDDAFVRLDPSNEMAVMVQELDVGRGPVLAELPNRGQNANPFDWELPAILPVDTKRRRERACAQPLLSPEDQNLERRVHSQRVGQPALPEGLLDPA